MKKNIQFGFVFALLMAAAPFAAKAQTTFFTDNFSNGSTTNLTSIPGGTATASSTSYDIASTKSTVPGANGVSITPNDLRLALTANTTSGFLEAQALFATNPIALSQPGDYIDIAVVFTNTAGTLLAGSTTAAYLELGLFDSGSVYGAVTNYPVPGGQLATGGLTTTASSPFATGNCADWQGYFAQVSATQDKFITRPLQNGSGTTSANQDLVGNGFGSGAFNNPTGTQLGSTANQSTTLTAGSVYTMELKITQNAGNVLTITNNLYNGIGAVGTPIMSQGNTNIYGATYLTAAFDGLAIGARNSGTSLDPQMDIYSILITGQSTVVTSPPTITSEPVDVTVATNGACAFSVAATGFNMSYQWYRNGAALTNFGNMSGVTTPQLIVSPAGTSDIASEVNGYYVIVTGTGPYSTNSITNSLVLIPATNLVWSGSGNVWDLNTSANWVDSNLNPQVFNYGDPVTFNDYASGGLTYLTLTGNFLSASSVTVDGTTPYTFNGNGSFAGPGSLLYEGSGQLSINNANTYTGGTTISNANAFLYLENYNGLGTGPLTLAKAGGKMEITPSGGASLGLGDINVADDFTIQFDAAGTYAGVILGDLSGTSGKTLTLQPTSSNSTTNARVRVYGQNTIYNANLQLNSNGDPLLITLAPYNSGGSQTYNGVISGDGSLIQRGSGTTILNGANTYSGGTTPSSGSIGFGINTVVVGGNVVSGPIGTGPLFIIPEVPSLGGSGTVLASLGARTIANPIEYPSVTNNLTLIVGGTNNLTFTGPFTLNGNDAAGSPTNRVVQINNTGATAFAGVISDGGYGFSFTKTGTNALYLNGANTYTGPTTNSAGLLAGTGSLASPVFVQTNASIGGGSATAIGTFTINGNLVLKGNGFFRLNKSLSPAATNDSVSVTGILLTNAGTGTITVTNLGATLASGDKFKLFSQMVTNGAALTVTGGGVNWVNNLAVDGTIQVLSTVATNPTNILYSITGGGTSLSLSWPQDHLGWYLQAQTNSLKKGISTNWVDIAGSSSVTTVVVPLVSTNPTVFYRMSLQP